MYNRYIPQPDGTYRRNRIQDSGNASAPAPDPMQQQPVPPPIPEPEPRPYRDCPHRPPVRKPQQNYQPRQSISITGFLKQLLPKNFDAEDLLVILLLLLMSGDCQEDQNTALLTLALYLFL